VNNTQYIIKQLPQATAFLNTKLQLVFASNSWLDLLDVKTRNFTGKAIDKVLGNPSTAETKCLKDALKGFTGQLTLTCTSPQDQEKRHLLNTYAPWYDDAENVMGVIIETTDITHTITKENELKKLQKQLAHVSEIARIGHWEYLVPNDNFTYCDTTKAIFGVDGHYEPSIKEGINFFKEGFSRNTISMAIYQAVENNLPWREKLQLVDHTGKEKWVITTGKPIFNGDNLAGFRGTFQDVDKQVVSAMKTKESQQLLQTLIDNLPINVFIKDIDSKRVLVNNSESEFLGALKKEDAIGTDDFTFFSNGFATKSRAEDLNVMESLNPILNKETTCILKDGSKTSRLFSKIPMLGNDGRIAGILGFSLDISEMKRKEAELHKLIDINAAQNKKLVNFAHIVSHNLRSHTANFSMLLNFLVSETDQHEKNQIIIMLIKASDRLLETLDNLNTVVDINNNINLKKESLVVKDRLNQILKNLSGALNNNSAKVVNLIPADLQVNAVPPYFDNIFINLITNALQYKSTKKNPEITLSARVNKHNVVLSVADNGLGIDLEKYGEKLFGMYKTFHDHCNARGIGLYITKNQMEAMNGSITVESNVGLGSTFNLHFNTLNIH